MFIFILSSTAQVTPTPPNTNSHTSVTTSVSNSTSVSDSDDTYKFISRFHSSKKIQIQELLSAQLKEFGLKISGTKYVWSEERNGSLVFECELTNRKLKMFLDKNEVSNSFYKKINAVGVALQKMITNHRNTNYKYSALNDAKENVRRASRALERAKERLKIVERGNN